MNDVVRGIPVALLLALACGCDTGPELAPASGIVRFQGAPVPEGTITFYPESGKPAAGPIESDGRFMLTTNKRHDGATPGSAKVVIRAIKIEQESSPAASFVEEIQKSQVASARVAPKVRWLAPEKYSDRSTTPLTAEVNPGENKFEFNLQP